MDKVHSSVQRAIKPSFNKMILNEFETCSVCGYQIPRTEQAFIFKGNIVCIECDHELRRKTKITVDIPNIKYKIKDNKKKDAKNMNADTEFNIGSKTNKLRAFGKTNITEKFSDSDNGDILFKKTEKEYNNPSDDLFNTNSQTNNKQAKIQLPPIIHSYFIEKNFSTVEPEIKNYHALGGFVISICIIGILVAGALFAFRYFM